MSSRIRFQILQITYPEPFSLAISATTRWPILRLFLRDCYGTYRFLGLELVIESIPQDPNPLEGRFFELMQSAFDEVVAEREAEMQEASLLTSR